MESRVLLCSASTFGFLSHLQKLARECGNNCSHKSVSFVSARPVGKGRISCICGGGGELRPALLLESSDLIGKPGHICVAASSSPAGGERFRRVREAKIAPVGFVEKYPTLVTGFFFFMWYFLNVIFNIINKKIYNYFPYPYFVSAVHLFVGVVYCLVSWAVGLPKRAPIDSNLLKLLIPVAVCHALGHVTINVSFAAVAVSHSYNQSSFLGHKVALVVLGVSMASLTKLSFNWTGFISAMIANISFTYRSLYSKKAMTDMDGTNVYAYISIIALFVCIPPAIIVEGPQLMKHGFNDAIAKVGLTKFLSDLFWVGMFYHLYNQVEGPQLMKHGFNDAIAKVGLTKFLSDLFWVGMFYHLYNQMATKTLERVALLTHAVGNVLKRVFVIGFSILVFGNKISTQTGIGKAIAIAGVAIYSYIKAKMEEEKRVKLLP